MEPGIQTPDETLEKRSGSCRDSAWLLVQLLRHLGLAARFASGYLDSAEARPEIARRAFGRRVRFHRSARMVRGVSAGRGLGRARSDVGPVRRRRPYPARVRGVAHRGVADQRRARGLRGRVRLRDDASRACSSGLASQSRTRTISGARSSGSATRSTRFSRRAMCGSPWAASRPSSRSTTWKARSGRRPRSGPTKRAFADTLIRRLRDRFAPGGLLHYGQGKWYPGESLPRWAFALYWRGDGLPLWREADRIATERRNYAPSADDARELAHGIARTPRPQSRLRDAGLRGSLALSRQGAGAAGQCRSSRLEARGRRRARAARARVRARSGQTRGLRHAGAALERTRSAPLAHGTVADTQRPPDADAGRFTGGIPVAAGVPALASAGAARLRPTTRSVRFSAAASERRLLSSALSLRNDARSVMAGATPRGRARDADRGRNGADGADRRAARRTALRVHAADRNGRGLSRSALQHRRCRGRASTPRFTSKAIRRLTIRGST